MRERGGRVKQSTPRDDSYLKTRKHHEFIYVNQKRSSIVVLTFTTSIHFVYTKPLLLFKFIAFNVPPVIDFRDRIKEFSANIKRLISENKLSSS